MKYHLAEILSSSTVITSQMPTSASGTSTRKDVRVSSRRDYYKDPNAPKANSLVPGASVLVTDAAGRILMQRRYDSGNWSLPGGVMEIGDTLEQCAVR